MSTEEGFKWWKKNADDSEKMIFDLTPGIYSLKLLRAKQALALDKERKQVNSHAVIQNVTPGQTMTK